MSCPKRQTNFATDDIQQPLRQIFRFARLPFGLILSQNVFYKELDNALEVLQGVTGIADDNFVYGSTEKENDENLPQMQERARAERITFSADKLQLKFIEESFFGLTRTPEGVNLDNKIVAPILAMTPPKNGKDDEPSLA